MDEDGKIHEHLDLSREYAAVARAALTAGHDSGAYHNALHALELGLKAALLLRLPEVPRTHNVGGIFALHFRDIVGADTCSRINRLVRDYDLPRYPDWEPHAQVAQEVAFILDFLETSLPRILGGSR